MHFFDLDETDYTNILAGALNQYVRARSEQKLPAPSTPHAKRQSYKNLDKSSCFDLIQRISESSLLVLEIKVTSDGKRLNSFNARQRLIDSVLREVGIPLEYCYNKKDDYGDVNDDKYTLNESMTSPPDSVSDDYGKLTALESHVSLKNLVDSLLEAPSGNGSAVGALLDKGLITRIRNLNIKLLFFCYSVDDLLMLSDADIENIYAAYKKYVTLGKGVNLSTASREEIVEDFSRNAEALRHLLENHKRQMARRDRPSLRSGGLRM